jgi:signal transduction histidine kinase
MGDESSVRPPSERGHRWLWRSALVVTAGAMLALLLSTASRIEAQTRADNEKELLTVLRATQGALRLWKDDVRSDHLALSELPKVRSLVEAGLRNGDDGGDRSLRDAFREVLAPWTEAHGYLGFSAMTADGRGGYRPIFGPDARLPELPERAAHVVAMALRGTFALGQPVVSTDPLLRRAGHAAEIVMVAATPVRGASGETIAALVFFLDAFDLFTSVTQLGRLGASGETYAVNRAGEMVTRSRFVPGSPSGGDARAIASAPGVTPLLARDGEADPGGGTGSARPLTRAAEHLRRGESGVDLDGYQDYRGHLVIGAWTWDHALDLGLVTEVDKAEAEQSNDMIQHLIRYMVTMVVLGMSAIVVFREARVRNLARIELLQRTDRARKDILAVVSHDLKGPLNALLITNDLLLKTLPPDREFSDRRRMLLRRSRRSAEQMRQLVADLLDAARIEAGRLAIHPVACQVTDLVGRTLELYEPIAEERAVTLVHDVPDNLPALRADADRIVQVLSNLVGNAVKFTGPGGRVTIRAGATASTVQFSVRDTGPGIPAQDLPNVFDRYWQATETQRFGTGLGLAICKEIVAAHAGRIWVESELGHGTVFHFTLPTEGPPPPGARR